MSENEDVKAGIGATNKEKIAIAASKFGTIKTSIFYYIPPFLIILILCVIFIVVMGFEELFRYYQASIPLNTLIIAILLFSVCMSIYNNIMLWKAGKFMNELDAAASFDEINSDDVGRLQSSLRTKGHMMDTKQMAEVIEKMKDYGQVQFNDTEARIIKSKFGYRARLNFSSVGYLAGILVMLGLLGTFLGLLGTIDAVGNAMGSMGAMGDGQGNMEEKMASFITGLSAPLQGMGVAFSSSLFGLSGSLLIGFVNHLCGGSQNNFIEDVSRWIDEHIPSPTSKMKKIAADKRVPQGDDLKAWLASFVFMSNKMNRRLGQLFLALSKSDELSTQSARYTELICSYQSDIKNNVEKIGGGIEKIGGGLENVLGEIRNNSSAVNNVSNQLNANLNAVNGSFSYMNQEVALIKDCLVGIHGSVEPMSKSINQSIEMEKNIYQQIKEQRVEFQHALSEFNDNMNNVSNSFGDVSESLKQTVNQVDQTTRDGFKSLSEGYASVNNVLNSQLSKDKQLEGKLSELTSLFSTFVDSQNNFVYEVSEIKDYLKNEQNHAKVSNLVFEMNGILEEMNQKNPSKFFDMFPNNKDS